MRPRRLLPLSAALILSFGCTGKKESFPQAPVILISVDTLRADHLPCYGYRGVETPNLDALARESVRYENAYSHVPLTLPSHVTLLTGLLPYENGVRDNIGFRVSSKEVTLQGLLRRNGYATGAAVSSYVLRADRGLASGFDLYDDAFEPDSPDERPGDQTAEKLERWIESGAASGRPVFVFLHLYEPHTPYAPPEPFRSRYARNLYDGEIAAADAVVGRFVSYLQRKNLYDRGILLFLSDHGEGLNDHGEDEHGVFLYREVTRVPMLLKLPGQRHAGEVVATPVALVDVLPTLLGLVGLPVPARVSGVPLPLSRSARPPAPRRIYSETLYPRLELGWSDLSSLTDSQYQYIEAPRPELYDLSSDPEEKHDLSSRRPPAFRSLRVELDGLNRSAAAPEGSSPEELKRLASLGYVSVSRGGGPGNLPDPKDRIEALKRYKRLFALFYGKKDAETVALAREILSEEPGILSVWRMLGASLARMRRFRDAARELAAGLERAGQNGVGEEISQTYEQLAGVLRDSGDLAGSERVLREALGRGLATEAMKRRLAELLTDSGRAAEALALLPAAAEPQDVETLDARGVALAESGRLPEARAAFEEALRADGQNAGVLFHLGNLSLRENDPASAKKWFENALQSKPGAPGILAALGLADARLGNEREARESWEKALALDPSQHDALFNLALLQGRSGEREQARRNLKRFLATAPRDRYPAQRAQAQRLLRALAGAS